MPEHQNCTETKGLKREVEETDSDTTEEKWEGGLTLKKSWKDLLGFYTAESISPKVDLEKRKYRNEKHKQTNKQTHDRQTNKKIYKRSC